MARDSNQFEGFRDSHAGVITNNNPLRITKWKKMHLKKDKIMPENKSDKLRVSTWM